VLERWPLVGRDREIGEVSRILTTGTYRGVALAGKPGVGKSRLADEAVSAAQDAGWTVRRIAATTTSQSMSLGAFSQWIDDPEDPPLSLVAKVIAALCAGAEPGRLLVSVDDAHLLDDPSAHLVHRIVQTDAARVVVTIRTGETAPGAVTALWKDGFVARQELSALSRVNTDELLAVALGAAPDPASSDRLWELTKGNALYLRQLVEQEHRAGRFVVEHGAAHWLGPSEVPATLAEVVDAHIGAVPDPVRDVVDYVAVANPIDWHTLRVLADQAGIEEAEQRELIRTSDDMVYVGHPMYAEVRLARSGPSRLRRLRGQIAMAMKDGGGAAAIRRGVLWLESDLPPDPHVLISAATAATALLNYELAERLLNAAADAGGNGETRVPLAYALFMLRKGKLAEQVLDDIDADATPPQGWLNEVILRASNLLWSMRSPEESWRVIDEALETADGPLRQALLVLRASQLSLAARPAKVLEVMSGVDYTQLDASGVMMGLNAECMSYGELGQPDRAAAKAEASQRNIGLGVQGKFLDQPLAEFHVFALAGAGRVTEALDLAGHRIRQDGEPASVRASAAQIFGMAALAAGDLEAALRYLPAELDPALVNDFHVANSFYRFCLLRVQALARSGDADAAEQTLRLARAHAHPAYEYVTSTELLAQAWLAAARQHLTQARQLAWRAAEFAREHGQLAREVWCLQTAAQFGETKLAARLERLANLVEGPRAAVAAHHAAALDADDGHELDRVSVEFEAMGDVLAAADVASQAATAHRRAGRTGSAITSAGRASQLAAKCGGATSPAIAAASSALPFTERELEIAMLLAQGLSNRDIADAMSLSIRTVEGYIYRACNKVGVKGRGDLADVVRSIGY